MHKYDLCQCGARKRSVSVRCRKCSYERPSAKQLEANRINGEARRVRFDELVWDDFTADSGGRFRTFYWPAGATRRRKLYRYQWVWLKAGREIPRGYDIHHKDGNFKNDEIDNLELKAHSQHTAHHMRENHPTSKLSAKDVAAIRASSLPRWLLAQQYLVSHSCISRVRSGKSHKGVPDVA